MNTPNEVIDEIEASKKRTAKISEAITEGIEGYTKFQNCEASPVTESLIVIGSTAIGGGIGYAINKGTVAVASTVPFVGKPLGRVIDKATSSLPTTGAAVGTALGIIVVDQHKKECEESNRSTSPNIASNQSVALDQLNQEDGTSYKPVQATGQRSELSINENTEPSVERKVMIESQLTTKQIEFLKPMPQATIDTSSHLPQQIPKFTDLATPGLESDLQAFNKQQNMTPLSIAGPIQATTNASLTQGNIGLADAAPAPNNPSAKIFAEDAKQRLEQLMSPVPGITVSTPSPVQQTPAFLTPPASQPVPRQVPMNANANYGAYMNAGRNRFMIGGYRRYG